MFDSERLLETIREKKTLTERDQEIIRLLLEDAAKDAALSKNRELSNGDTVTVKTSLEKKLLKDYGILFKNGSKEVTVENLVDIREIPLADYILLNPHGFNGKGEVYLDLDWAGLSETVKAQILAVDDSLEAQQYIEETLETFLGQITYSPMYMSELSNGDTIEVSFSAEETEIETYGIRLLTDSVTRTAEGFPEAETVALMDYVSVETEGYSGAGSAYASLNQELLALDLQEIFEEKQRGAYGTFYEGMDYAGEAQNAAEKVADVWRDLIQLEFSAQSDLYNGDVLTLTGTLTQENGCIWSVGICLEGGSKEIEVTDLMEPQEVDLAEALNITFSGTCPEVYAEFEVDYDLPYVYWTSLSDLPYREKITAENGERYEGEITYEEKPLLEAGYKVINSAYSYTISGLNTYQFSAETLEEEAFQALDALFQETVQREFTGNYPLIAEQAGGRRYWIGWERSEILLESARHLFCQGEYDTESELCLIYHGAYPVKLMDRTEVGQDSYYVVRLYDAEETEDGTFIYSDYWSGDWYASREEMEEAFDSWITQMGETTEVTEYSQAEGQEAKAELQTETWISGAAAETDTSVSGEIQGNAENLAARVIAYEGHLYARYDIPYSWNLAKKFCEAAGGHLVTVTSKRESAIMDQLLEDSPYEFYYMGAADEGWEGGWQWITGESFDWTHWRDGQPDNSSMNDSGEENYLEIRKEYDGYWNDGDGTGSDANNGFILEIDPASEQTGTVQYLSDLTAQYRLDSEVWDYVQDSYGNDHFCSQALNAAQNGMAIFTLNGQWKTLSGKISTWAEAESDSSFQIKIWGDDRLLYEYYDYQKTDAPMNFCIEVAGVNRLFIETVSYGEGSSEYLFLHEAVLTAAEEVQTEEMQTEETLLLGELKVIASNGYTADEKDGLYDDYYGNLHRDWNQFAAGEGAGALYLLNGAYTSLEAVLVVPPGVCNETTSVGMEILADGERLFLVENYDIYQGALPIALDLSGKKQLEILTWTDGEQQNGTLALVDTALKKSVQSSEEGITAPEFPELPDAVSAKAVKWLTSGNYRYYLFEEALTWSQADAFCKAAGGVLASPVTEEKNEAITDLISYGHQEEYWIGGALTGNVWMMSNGDVLGEFANWSSGQPDNYEEQEFLLSMYEDGTWNDNSPETQMGFVMEIEASEQKKDESLTALADLEWAESTSAEVCTVINRSEEELFVKSIEMNASENAEFTVNLNGAYTLLEGMLFPAVYASDNISLQLAVFGDGVCLCEYKNLTKDQEGICFSADVTGVKELTIAAANTGSRDYGVLYLADVRLTPAETPVQPSVCRLLDLVTVDLTGMEPIREVFQDSYGEFHDRYLYMETGADNRAVYNLDGAYTSLQGTITAAGRTAEDTVTRIAFLADQEEIYVIEDFEKKKGAVSFQIDLTGKQILEIRASEEENRETAVYLTEDQLF